MMRFAMLASLAVVPLCAIPGVAVADEVPTLDVGTLCRAEARADPTTGAATACLADEQKARETLVSQWTQFALESRTSCLQMAAGVAGVQSYVELLSCLQIGREVKGLPKE